MNIENVKDIINNDEDFTGVIKISEKGKTLVHMTKGFANKFEEIPNKLDTSFGIASGTKGFTALAVLQLVDEGKLKLEDNVFEILPYDFPNVKTPITIQQLLSHTSGIYDYFDEDVLEDFEEMFKIVPASKIYGPTDMLPLLTAGECYFSPGEKYKYCNSGFVILGMLVEVVSKQKYSDYLSEHIIKPLGLQGTGCYKSNQLPKNTAQGYMENSDGTWKTNVYEIPMTCTADGGLYTTADDMQKFWNGIMNGNMLSDSLKEKVFKKHAKIDDGYHYGLGFYIILNDDDSVRFYGLVGFDPGASFISRYYPKTQRIYTVVSNTDFGVWDLTKKLNEYLMA